MNADWNKLEILQRAELVLLQGRIELEAMLAENAERQAKGLAQAYPESAFHELAARTQANFAQARYYL